MVPMHLYPLNANTSSKKRPSTAFSGWIIAALSFLLSCDPHDRVQTEVIRDGLKRSPGFAEADVGTADPRSTRLANPSLRNERYLVAQFDSAPTESIRGGLIAAGLQPIAHLPAARLLLERAATSTPEAED
jgi:hypothetical protein